MDPDGEAVKVADAPTADAYENVVVVVEMRPLLIRKMTPAVVPFQNDIWSCMQLSFSRKMLDS